MCCRVGGKKKKKKVNLFCKATILQEKLIIKKKLLIQSILPSNRWKEQDGRRKKGEKGLRRGSMWQCGQGSLLRGYCDFTGHGKVNKKKSLYQLIDAINFICRIYCTDLTVNTSVRKYSDIISLLHFIVNKFKHSYLHVNLSTAKETVLPLPFQFGCILFHFLA